MGRRPRLLSLSGQVRKPVEQSFYWEMKYDDLKHQEGGMI
jgi:hypothetical protein